MPHHLVLAVDLDHPVVERIGDQDVVWSESVELKSSAPMYIQLNKIIP